MDSVLDREPPPADVRVVYGSAPEHFADLRRPSGRKGPFPTVAFIHGGFWRARYDLLHAGHLCAALTAKGVATWNLEYRRLGNEGGGWPGTFLDVAAGLHALVASAADLGVDPARIAVMGHSAGGHLALWAAGLGKIAKSSEIAAEPLPLRGAVSLAGVVDLREASRLQLSANVVEDLLGGSPEEVPERYAAASPIELVPIGGRQILIHGEDDEIVPISISEGYVETARAAGDDATLISLPGTDHFAVIDPLSAVWPAVETAVLSLLDE
jgi:acetyl esterase/lipase